MATQGRRVAVVRPGVLTDAAFGAALKAGATLGADTILWPMTGPVPSLKAKAREAKKAKMQLLLENVAVSSADAADTLRAVGNDAGLAMNPANFAAAGELPFLQSYRQVKRFIRYLAMTDGSPLGVPCLLGQGYGEVRELISILRCASWGGYVSIGAPPAAGLNFDAMTDAFYDALDNI